MKFYLICTGLARVLMEIGYWDIVLCVWVVFSIFSILAISMARSKNSGKGKAPSSFMERDVKKRKVDSSQTIKKGKGKLRDSSLRVRRHRRAKMRRSKPCFPRLLIQNRKSGPNRLQNGVFIASGG